MTKPPIQIDGADEVAYTILDRQSTKILEHYACTLAAYCRATSMGWRLPHMTSTDTTFSSATQNGKLRTDTLHDSVDEAIETAKRKFGILLDDWCFLLRRVAT